MSIFSHSSFYHSSFYHSSWGSFGGLGIVVVAQAAYLVTIGLRRTLPTRIFDVLVLAGFAIALTGAFFGDDRWPTMAAGAMTLVWLAITRNELRLPRPQPKLKVGDRLPELTLLTTSKGPLSTLHIIERAPAMIVLYRGWWCPYCVTQLNELKAEHDAFTKSGLSLFAVSVDRPEEQLPLENRLDQRVTFLS